MSLGDTSGWTSWVTIGKAGHLELTKIFASRSLTKRCCCWRTSEFYGHYLCDLRFDRLIVIWVKMLYSRAQQNLIAKRSFQFHIGTVIVSLSEIKTHALAHIRLSNFDMMHQYSALILLRAIKTLLFMKRKHSFLNLFDIIQSFSWVRLGAVLHLTSPTDRCDV